MNKVIYFRASIGGAAIDEGRKGKTYFKKNNKVCALNQCIVLKVNPKVECIGAAQMARPACQWGVN